MFIILSYNPVTLSQVCCLTRTTSLYKVGLIASFKLFHFQLSSLNKSVLVTIPTEKVFTFFAADLVYTNEIVSCSVALGWRQVEIIHTNSSLNPWFHTNEIRSWNLSSFKGSPVEIHFLHTVQIKLKVITECICTWSTKLLLWKLNCTKRFAPIIRIVDPWVTNKIWNWNWAPEIGI